MPTSDSSKPLATYEDWKGSVLTLYLNNSKALRKIEVLDLWMTAMGPPLALRCKYRTQIINVPYEKVMYYIIHD